MLNMLNKLQYRFGRRERRNWRFVPKVGLLALVLVHRGQRIGREERSGGQI